MTDRSPTGDHGSDEAAKSAGETEQQRLNREFDQLLAGMRTALPGVQVLLAFLLTVPFTQRFPSTDSDAKGMYFAAVILSAVASILMIAPSIHHRIRFRQGTKEEMITEATRFAVIGAGCLGLAIGAVAYVVGDVAFPGSPARWTGPVLVVFAAVIWFVVPMRFKPDQTPRS